VSIPAEKSSTSAWLSSHFIASFVIRAMCLLRASLCHKNVITIAISADLSVRLVWLTSHHSLSWNFLLTMRSLPTHNLQRRSGGPPSLSRSLPCSSAWLSRILWCICLMVFVRPSQVRRS
jgi:hypothetical protein